MIKVIHLSTTDYEGGAARAAYRINEALNNASNNEIKSILRVSKRITSNKTVISHNSKNIFFNRFKCFISLKLQKLQHSNNPILHSISVFPSNLHIELNKSSADIIHLHWIQGEMISIEEIGKITKPIVWTLHDSWPFCGSEHHPCGLDDLRYQYGYKKNNRDKNHKGIDLDRWTWNRKKNSWKNSMNIVSPSIWLSNCVKKSKLMSHYPVEVIPHTLPLDIYKPKSKKKARKYFGLPQKVKLLLFGSLSFYSDNSKGWDLFNESINKIGRKDSKIEVVIFGSPKPKNLPKLNLPLHFVGRLFDDELIALLYSAVDIVVVTSKIESFGQIASEAQSCGTPVVAFNTTGLKDIVKHKETGYLAKPYSSESLTEGIIWILKDKERKIKLSKNARSRSISIWSNEVISKKYKNLYKDILNK